MTPLLPFFCCSGGYAARTAKEREQWCHTPIPKRSNQGAKENTMKLKIMLRYVRYVLSTLATLGYLGAN